jgi:photosystem II stability/assembly factor-like uncharacterized protein
LRDVAFADHQNGWTVGDDSYIMHTIDSGRTWQNEVIVPMGSLNGLNVLSPSKVWAVGDMGAILSTNDSGRTWQRQPTPVVYTLHDVTFIDTVTGWVVGSGGTILHTDDGGDNWLEQSSGVQTLLRGVDFPTATEGWAVGEAGVILHTTNAGQTWTPATSECIYDLWDIASYGPTNVWATGAHGTILRYNGTEFTPINGGKLRVASSYALSVYPNPFNPQTTLAFDIPMGGRLQLAVYDVTGRLVETLANRFYPQGQYRLNFDASALPSGVYFARLNGKSFAVTQKLVLLK